MTDTGKELVDKCRRYRPETGLSRRDVENMGKSSQLLSSELRELGYHA